MTKFKDTTGTVKTPADFGGTWLSDEAAAALGLTEVADDYERAPTADELMALKLAAIDAEYQPKFAACEELLRRMLLTDKDITDLKARYSALSNEKDAKILEVMEAV